VEPRVVRAVTVDRVRVQDYKVRFVAGRAASRAATGDRRLKKSRVG
jgi:hypothetical protein